MGDVTATSFHPAKAFSCYGDGGCVFTNNDSIAHKIRALIHKRAECKGEYIGVNSRLDTIHGISRSQGERAETHACVASLSLLFTTTRSVSSA